MTVPEPAAPPPPPEVADTYELVTEDLTTADRMVIQPNRGRCPNCNVALAKGAVICMNCGLNLLEGKGITTAVLAGGAAGAAAGPQDVHDADFGPILATQSALARALERREFEEPPDRIADLYLPLGFIVLGIVLIVVGSVRATDTPLEAAILTGLVMAVQLCFMVPLMLVALIISAKLFGVSFGTLFLGLFKLTGLALGPATVADFIFVTIAPFFAIGIYGLVAVVFLMFLLYAIFMGIPMSKMFKLEATEVMQTIWVIVTAKLVSVVFGGMLIYVLMS
jgi:hypothetical protein